MKNIYKILIFAALSGSIISCHDTKSPNYEYFPKMYYWDRTLWETALSFDEKINELSLYYPKRFLMQTLEIFGPCDFLVEPLESLNIEKPFNMISPTFKTFSKSV